MARSKNLGSLFVSLGLDDKRFNTDLAKAQKNLRRTGRNFTNVGRELTTKITAPLALAGGAAVKFAVDFNKSMANVATLIPNNTKRVSELGKSVQKLAIETGTSTQDLSDGLYQTVSAFGDSADSAKRLEIAVKGAKAGVATTTDSLNLLSSVTKGYGDTSAEALQQVSDLAFQTVKLGQTTFPELAASMGKVVPLASELAVSQEELFAVMATATGVTGKASEVSTQLRGVLQSLLAPTGQMTDLYEQLGIKSGEALLEQQGLGGAIQTIITAAEESNVPLQKFIGSIEGQTLALALTGSQAETYQQKLEAMGVAAGATQEAFNEQTQGINAVGFSFSQLQQSVTVALQNVGNAILETFGPQISATITGLSQTIVGLANGFSNLSPKLQKFIVVFGGLAAVAGPILIGLGAVATLLGGPLALAVIGITGVVAAGTAVWVAYGDDIKAVVNKAFGYISDFWKKVKDIFAKIVKGIDNTIKAFTNFGAKVKKAFAGMADESISSVNEMFVKINNLVVGKFNGIADDFNRGIDRITGGFASMYDAVVGNSYVPDMVLEVEDWFSRMSDSMIGKTNEAIDGVNAAFTDIGGFSELPEEAFGQGQNIGDELARGVFEAFSNGGNGRQKLVAAATTAGDILGASIGIPGAGQFLNPYFQDLSQIGTSRNSTINGATSFLTGGIDSVLGNPLGNAIGGFFSNGDSQSAGRKGVEGFLEEGLGANVVFGDRGRFEEDWASTFSQIAGEGQGAFEAIGLAITQLAGETEVAGEQIGFILAENLNGNIDTARLLTRELGLDTESLTAVMLQAGESGASSWREVSDSLANVNQLTGEGLVGVGDLRGGFDRLLLSAGRGTTATNALRDVIIEALESGVSTLEGLEQKMIESGNFTEDEITKLMSALEKNGVNSLEELKGASTQALGEIIANLDRLGLEWGSVSEDVQKVVADFNDLERALAGIPDDLEIKVRVNYEAVGDTSVLENANGNGFDLGNVLPFANGGVVNRPTLFPMANGAGLMGEAGPEAIMPLKRNSEGKLGVIAEGGGGQTVNYNIDARGAAVGVEQKIVAAIEAARPYIVRDSVKATSDLINRGAF